MKKIFLIPLMACFSCVMAWGATNVAKIGDTNYTSFNTAFAAATEGQTIVLLTNITKASNATNELRTVSANITIDGQGQYSVSRAFQVSANKTLTLKDVTVNNGVKCNPAGAIVLNNGATVVLDNAEIAPAVAAVLPVRTVQGASGTIQLVSGSTNVIRNNAGTALYTFNQTAGDNSSVLTISGEGNLTVYHTGTTGYVFSANANGGSFLVNAPNVTFVPSDPTKFIGANAKLADGYLALYENGVYKVVPTSDSRITAVVDGIAYPSIAAAVEAASTYDEITLYADAQTTTISKSLTIKSNGHNASAISAGAGYTRVAIEGGYVFGKAASKSGNVYTVNNFDELWFTINTAVDGDVITLAADIAYPTNGQAANLLNITKSITIDGKGYTLSGWSKANIGINRTTNESVTLAVNYGGESSAALDVTIKNITVTNSGTGDRSMAVIAYDGVEKLTFTNANLIIDMKASWVMGLLVTGADATPLQLKIEDSFVTTGDGKGYPAYFCKPIAGTFKNTEFKGYCALYFKYRYSAAYGEVVGPRGSVVNADACTFTTLNYHNSATNGFAVFAIEDDGITLNLHNCSGNAKQTGTQKQSMISLQAKSRTEGFQKVAVNITGDNSHYYNFQLPYFSLTGWNTDDDDHPNDYKPSIDVPFELNISGGTFAVDPSQIKYHTYADGGNGYNVEYAYIDPTKYEVKEVSQGGVPLYRVVPKTTTLYNLNSDVQDEGAGQNPNTSFELSTGTDMTLNQATTKAGYVEVSNNTTVTVATDQALVINNGLDVQGTSLVTAKPGSALVIGEGGIVTQAPENIVVEANQNGAASLLLDPTITVNQTPELTVKMTAHNVGKIGEDYFWHRFALPIDQVRADDGSWSKDDHTYGTLLYKWDYTNNKWASLQELDEMKPFYGYTLSLEEIVANPDELKDAGYIFKGNLTGNVNSTLEFSRQGYNFFGNSYTGYISVLKLVDELIGNADIDGTVWMWNSEEQQYEDVPLNDLRNNPTAARYTGVNAWRAEVAPMQTFILRLLTENTDATAEINYATAVWGNPRYDAVTGANNAPVRRVASTNDTYVRIIVTDANGKKDAVKFLEDANFSDAYDKGFDGSKYMNERTVNVYATVNGENYGTVATDNIEGKMLTICTTDEIAYTISFADVEGNEYALRDNVTGKVIAIEEGATYEFAAQPNSTIEGRFEILPIAKMPTAIENTEVKANAKGIYTLTGQYLGEDFEAVPAGVYVVNGVKIVK